ncbi:galactofuranose ABC transporter, permease protein YjfF [Paenibacillus sp. YPG26]|uniref:galactofuranose ABC transporter, permease protein YjfF n=1 Tax=Paenibacillus sp. YPG26 TaxID=2878915 RepID=UPI00203FC434|nr:galactofuranose ABC transporter, permease protein YjfF [Paenibacillus sp. YPG26]USB34378.1 sugar ABC transporter permease YjfF [Paenibacillus sp. YPG26]
MNILKIDRRYFPILVTVALFVVMFAAGSIEYNGFFSLQVFLNLLIDNAFLLITAVGMTFVILTGGIDLSVGSMIAFTTMLSATLVQNHHWSPMLVIPFVLLIGSFFGWVMGSLIQYFKLQPFIVTLAGMFLARGLCYLISIESITIDHEWYKSVSQTKVYLFGSNYISISVIIALVVVAAAIYIAHYTKFGRNVYALGGSEQSSLLMGLPVARTKVLVYTLSGFCSSLAGVVFTFYMLSGYGLHAVGMELDTIAAVVIGGTLLTGGTGYVAGTVFGVLIQGIIQTLIMFQGTLSSWWTKIAIGLLLLMFILLQKVFISRKKKSSAAAA